MAEKSKVNIKCKILKFEENPTYKDGIEVRGQVVFVECSIGQRKWVKTLGLDYDRPISMEQFKKQLAKHVWEKEDKDPLRYVKEEADKEFTIITTRKKEV